MDREGQAMSIYRIGHGDSASHRHNERRAAIVRCHRRRMLEELRELERGEVVEVEGEAP